MSTGEPTAVHRIHAQRNATWAANLVAGFAANGVTDAIVSPGSRNTPLVLALDAAFGERTHVVVDERSAGFVALGLARASGRPVVLACTSGSAATHYYPAIVEAYYSRIPLIVVSADRPPELHHNGAGQTIEQERLFGRFVEWFADLGVPSGETEPRTWAHAAAHAVSKARGPVHLNVCFREPLWDAAVSYAPPSTPALQIHRSAAADVTFEMPALPRGVIVCGPRASSSPAFAAAVHALGARYGWPVLADAASGARGAESVACYDALLRASAFADAMRPQLVVTFGQRPASKALNAWLDAASATHILVSSDGAINDPAVVASQLVIADAVKFCEAQRGGSPQASWSSAWAKAEAAARQALERTTNDGLWEGSIARVVGAALPPAALLHVASSMPVRDLESFASRVPHVVSNRGANGIDGTIASASGAALAWNGPVVALMGDLAFQHDMGSLITARALNVELTLVVVDNGGGGIFDFLAIGASETRIREKYFTTPQPIDVSAIATAAGWNVVRATSISELESALTGSGQRVVHVVVPRERNVSRHRAAWAEVARAIDTL